VLDSKRNMSRRPSAQWSARHAVGARLSEGLGVAERMTKSSSASSSESASMANLKVSRLGWRILPVVVQPIHIVKWRRNELGNWQVVQGGQMHREKRSAHRVNSPVTMSRDSAS
jgi:hypothetical protein